MTGRVLVPFDGSPHSQRALEFAFDNFPAADVTAMYVIEIPEIPVFDDEERGLPVTRRAREFAESVLEEASEMAAGRDRDLETVVETGHAASRIIERADEESYDTIVLGSHGRTNVSDALLGGVTEKIVRTASVPVVVVR